MFGGQAFDGLKWLLPIGIVVGIVIGIILMLAGGWLWHHVAIVWR